MDLDRRRLRHLRDLRLPALAGRPNGTLIDGLSILFRYIQPDEVGVAKVAKLFANGGSQAVRLPAEFRFSGDEVYVHHDPLTGDVVLSSRPETWADFFALRDAVGPPPEFLAERPWNAAGPFRDPFAPPPAEPSAT